MTEKRFTFTQDTLAKADVFDGNEFVCCTLSVWVEQLVDLLNELAEENQQLINDCSILVQSNQEYRKENEQLKQLIKKTLETTPIEHTLAVELKNSVREFYD